jgi:hypothetical protein
MQRMCPITACPCFSPIFIGMFNRDFMGRAALHIAAINPSPEAGELTRRLVKVNAGAARSQDGYGQLPVELAFVSKSPSVGMVIACITTAFPDGALCEDGEGGDTMLHYGCSSEVVLSNKQALKMVKALLAFHPETASATNARLRIPLHVIALTDAPQANDIMEELIERYPRGLLQTDKDGNTPMHLAAAVNNIRGVRTLVTHSFSQPQHLHNENNRLPMDVTKNRQVIKALSTPPLRMKAFRKRERWYVKVATVASSLLLMATNGVILSHFYKQHLEHLDRDKLIARGELDLELVHPRDKRLYFMWCNGCGINSHMFYLVVVIALYVIWISFIIFMIVVRKYLKRSIEKYFETGWFQKHLRMSAELRENSPLMFAKSVERFVILFPTALLHIVACQQHPDKYWPGGEGLSGSPVQPIKYEQIFQIMGFALPMLLSAQTSVIMDQSTLHTVSLHLACCKWISLDVIEQMMLYLYRISEFCARVVVISYLWYGLDSCFHCQSDYCTCIFRWVALPVISAQFLITLIITSTERFWWSLCHEASRSFVATLDVIFNTHFALTIINSMGVYYTSGDGEIVGSGNLLRFIGELRLREGLIIIFLHLSVNAVMIVLAGMVRIYEESETQKESYTNRFDHLFVNLSRITFFVMACAGTAMMCITIGIRYLLWRVSAYGLEMRAKKVLIDLIMASRAKHHDQSLTHQTLMNYNLSLEQLQRIHKGDLSDLQISKKPLEEGQVRDTCPHLIKANTDCRVILDVGSPDRHEDCQ